MHLRFGSEPDPASLTVKAGDGTPGPWIVEGNPMIAPLKAVLSAGLVTGSVTLSFDNPPVLEWQDLMIRERAEN